MHRIHPTHLGARGASLLLALFILTPVLARAEEQRGLRSTPPPLRLLDTPWQDEEDVSMREPQQPSTQVRLSTELGLGLLAGAAAGAGGYLLGSSTPCSGSFLDLCAFNGPILGLWGVALGSSLGVWGGGELMGGDGRLLVVLAASHLGAVLSLFSFMLGPTVGIITTAVLPLGAAIAAYELSFQSETHHKESTRPRVSARPILAASAHGVLLGMGGSF
jgi:hypothetical protein